MRKISAFLVILALVVSIVFGCATYQAREQGADWRGMAIASCQDLNTAFLIAQSGVGWYRVYRPDKDEELRVKVEPALLAAKAALDLFCAAIPDMRTEAEYLVMREAAEAAVSEASAKFSEVER